MKTDLNDLTFLMPLRVDSVVRIENLCAVIRYLQRHFITNIAVLEAGSYNNGVLQKLLNSRVNYTFIEDKDPVFYRTQYINRMVETVKTPFLAVWDVDVVVDKIQIIDTMEKLRKGEADMAYPYDGQFYDTSDILRSLYMKKPQMKILHRNKERMTLLYGKNCRGGAFLANTEKYRWAGMENEKFYGWGPEDTERYARWINLRLNIYHTPGVMYHFTHPRDMNGHFNSSQQRQITVSERTKTCNSSYDELCCINHNNSVIW